MRQGSNITLMNAYAKHGKHGLLILGTSLCCVAGMAQTAASPYRAGELDVDLFGSGSVGQYTLDHISGDRIQHDGRLGVGAGVSYFFTEILGVGVDAGTESTSHYLVDRVSANFIARFPLADSGIAPYVLAGGGRQFDPSELWFGDAGAGIEFRFTPQVGVFADGRYVFTEHSPNYGLFRAGVRMAF
jgi:hypothetical protein